MTDSRKYHTLALYLVATLLLSLGGCVIPVLTTYEATMEAGGSSNDPERASFDPDREYVVVKYYKHRGFLDIAPSIELVGVAVVTPENTELSYPARFSTVILGGLPATFGQTPGVIAFMDGYWPAGEYGYGDSMEAERAFQPNRGKLDVRFRSQAIPSPFDESDFQKAEDFDQLGIDDRAIFLYILRTQPGAFVRTVTWSSSLTDEQKAMVLRQTLDVLARAGEQFPDVDMSPYEPAIKKLGTALARLAPEPEPASES